MRGSGLIGTNLKSVDLRFKISAVVLCCCCSAADAAAADVDAVGSPDAADGSLWCRGKPRLTRRYPPYPEMAQNLPITFVVLF